MQRSAVVLVMAAIVPLAGCLDGNEAPTLVLESFQAVYEYSDRGANREHGLLNVSLAPAADHLDGDLQLRKGYLLSVEWPDARDIEGGPVHNQRTHVVLDDRLAIVRSGSCYSSDEEQSACEIDTFRWPTKDEDGVAQPPLGFGLPLLLDANSRQRVHQGDGSILIEGHRYAPGRLVPDTWQERGLELTLVSYISGTPLDPVQRWPDPPVPPTGQGSYGFLMFPGEDQDLFGVGWTALDAIAHLRSDPEAAAILDEGGCVRAFQAWIHALESRVAGVPTNEGRSSGSVTIYLEDLDRQSSRWWFSRSTGSLALSAMEPAGFTDPEREDGWPFLHDHTCEQVRRGPQALAAGDVLGRVGPWVDLAHGVSFVATRQSPDAGHGGWTPASLGFTYMVDASPAYAYDVITSDFEAEGGLAGATIDAWTGRLGRLYTEENPPP